MAQTAEAGVFRLGGRQVLEKLCLEMVNNPLRFKQFSHSSLKKKPSAYLGWAAVVSAAVIADEIILNDVWFGFSFSGEALPTQEDLLIWLL